MTTQLILGDCLDAMKSMPDNSIDTCVTDPPYGLGFMGKKWDSSGVAFRVEIWKEVYRVLKPGAILLAFSGTRTYHRMVCAIEDAGFEIRDMFGWIYGSGFPKSLDISKAIEKSNGVKPIGKKPAYGAISSRELIDIRGWNNIENALIMPEKQTEDGKLWAGWGTALKPAHEPIVLAMKPLDGTFANNATKWGVAGLWIDGGRVGTDEELGRNNHVSPYGSSRTWNVSETPPQNNVGTAPHGRWPANIIQDGSEEAIKEFPNETHRFFYCAKSSQNERNAGLECAPRKKRDDSRNAGQPSMNGGEGNPYNRGAKEVTNHHPTVKPVELMRYLVRLTKTPTGGVVLDPFMGSGTTGIACVLEGRDFVGIELEEEYIEIAKKRIAKSEIQPNLL